MLCTGLLVLPALARADSAPVDLSLPQPPMFSGQSRFDRPYTGPRTDTPEYRQRHADPIARGGCPSDAAGQPRALSGSVTTGIGHASGVGTTHWNAVDLHLCREAGGDARNAMHLDLHVGRYDGPGYPGPGDGMRPLYIPGGPVGRFEPEWRGFDPFDAGALEGPRFRSWSDGRHPWR